MVVHYAGHIKAKEVEDQKWYVYVVRCNDNSLYCGVSKNVENRVAEHNG
ncbi:MAG: GIY-YIG nuclease family protein, partial [Chlamydiota bacterium]|nr:GIY-YIG nuclease family protein [Chlamydiota bacterium]